jgi:predicted DCC family thiol-disulfide oxidoreductase YuxK
MRTNSRQPIILFDGVCGLCNEFVKFVIEHDRNRIFLFAPLRSQAADRLMNDFKLTFADFDSIILIEGSRYFIKSEAALEIYRRLGGIWRLLYLFIILPQSWRDRMYDFIAKNRYRCFGKLEQCIVPNSETRKRFLN